MSNIEQETEGGNKLIALFDGWKFIPAHAWTFDKDVIQYKDSWVKTIDGKCNQIGEPPKYNLSWDLLMPVVEKIEDEFKAHVCIYNKSCWIEYYGLHDEGYKNHFKENVFINNVWLAVVEFLKWFNNNNKK